MKKLKNNNLKKIRCHRCEKLWLTRSLNPYYVCCPRCKTSVNVRKNKIQSEYLVGASTPPESIRIEVTDE